MTSPTIGPATPTDAAATHEPVHLQAPADHIADAGDAADPDAGARHDRVVRLYYGSLSVLQRAHRLAAAVLAGTWLGVLSRRRIHAIDRAHYAKRRMYWTGEYNRRGLWDWERAVVEAAFVGRRRVIVPAAGGGREVLALRHAGFEAVGFECNRGLVRVANTLLLADGFPDAVVEAEWDECPRLADDFDAAIVGWGAYTHVRGRQRRIAFLRELRQQLREGAPVLLSFWPQRRISRDLRIAAGLANALRLVTRVERAEPGDYLGPMYVRFLTESDIRHEAAEAGYAMESWASAPYGHALLRAAPAR